MKNKRLKIIIEHTLFSSKWLLVPFYLGLIIALINFIRIDVREVYNFLTDIDESKTGSMMFLLELIDMAMIAALVIMIVRGGYTSFICKNHDEEGGEKTSSGVLKVKLSTAIIGVSSISLLQYFMSIASAKFGESKVDTSWETVEKLLAIHAFLIIGALVLSVIEYLHVKSESIHNDDCEKHGHDMVTKEKIKDKHFESEVCEK